MAWGEAKSACEAYGKNMITHNGLTQSCSDPDSTGCSSMRTELSAFGKKLYEKGWSSSGFVGIWSSETAGSCCAYYTPLDQVTVDWTPERSYNLYAVCK